MKQDDTGKLSTFLVGDEFCGNGWGVAECYGYESCRGYCSWHLESLGIPFSMYVVGCRFGAGYGDCTGRG